MSVDMYPCTNIGGMRYVRTCTKLVAELLGVSSSLSSVGRGETWVEFGL